MHSFTVIIAPKRKACSHLTVRLYKITLARRASWKKPTLLLGQLGFYTFRAAIRQSVLHTAQTERLSCVPTCGKYSARQRPHAITEGPACRRAIQRSSREHFYGLGEYDISPKCRFALHSPLNAPSSWRSLRDNCIVKNIKTVNFVISQRRKACQKETLVLA